MLAQDLRIALLRGKHIEIDDYNGSGCRFIACAYSDGCANLSHPQIHIQRGAAQRVLNLTQKTTDKSMSDFISRAIGEICEAQA